MINGVKNTQIIGAIARPKSIATSKGHIQPAMGIEVKNNGDVILTAYRTSSQNHRYPTNQTDCRVRQASTASQ